MDSGSFWISGMWIFPALMILSVLVIFYIIFGKAHLKFISNFDKNDEKNKEKKNKSNHLQEKQKKFNNKTGKE